MTISWRGLSSFKIRENNINLLIDPLKRSYYGLRASKSKADICLLSSDFLKYEKRKLKNSFYNLGYPGEYEIKDINITISRSLGPDGKNNNIFTLDWNGIKLVHLGVLKLKTSISKLLEKINGTDVLMVPVGGKKVLKSDDAVEIVRQIEPSVVIPMFYKTEEQKDIFGLDDAKYFIQEIGQEKEKLDKLKVKKTSFKKEKTKLVVLKP